MVGTVDTCLFASRVREQRFSLEQVTDAVGIPLHRSAFGGADHLHCAGNDANYSLRDLLALLEMESPIALEALGRIAREDIPMAAPSSVERPESNDVGLAGTFLDEHCEY